MLREITVALGRYQVGSKHDYPLGVWNRIAASAKMSLEKFSKEIKDNPVHQSPIKSRPRVHQRLGASQ